MNKNTIVLIGTATLVRVGAGTGVDLFVPDCFPKCIGPADASHKKPVNKRLIKTTLSSGMPVSYVTLGHAGTPNIAGPENSKLCELTF